jgi:3D (Asp-Asp-Asp) domain-containing protein
MNKGFWKFIGIGVVVIMLMNCMEYLVKKYRHPKDSKYVEVEEYKRVCELVFELQKDVDILERRIEKTELNDGLLFLGEREVSAYTSVENQCDSSPFITASGDSLEDGDRIVATNMHGFNFGDSVEIEYLGAFCVQDRMNPKYRNRFDIWLGDSSETGSAQMFGVQKMLVWDKIRR